MEWLGADNHEYSYQFSAHLDVSYLECNLWSPQFSQKNQWNPSSHDRIAKGQIISKGVLVSLNSLWMNLWPVEHFGVVPVPQIEEKTGQRFIHKEESSYKIHSLDFFIVVC